MWGFQNRLCLSVRTPRKEITISFCQYQSYIGNWYINGKVFTSTTTWKPKNVNFKYLKLEIDEIEFCPYPEFPYAEKRNRSGFVNISPTLVTDTSIERSSSTTTWEQKIWFFFSKKFEIEFDLCWRAEINIQVGLTYMSTSGMHRRPFEGRHLVCISVLSVFPLNLFLSWYTCNVCY